MTDDQKSVTIEELNQTLLIPDRSEDKMVKQKIISLGDGRKICVDD